MGGSISDISGSGASNTVDAEKHLPDEYRPAFRTVQGKLEAAKLHKTSVQAPCLINKEKTKETYFSHLLKDAQKSDQPNAEQLPVNVTLTIHSYDSHDAREFRRATSEAFRPFCSDYSFEPAYSSLQIGDVILEWDETSLLLPRSPDKPLKPATSAPSDRLKHSETRLELSLTSQLLNDLVNVVVKYNTKYFYGTLSCNSHHLVQDVLDALDLQARAPDAFSAQILLHNTVLMTRQKKTEEFNSHGELDDHVRGNVQTMDEEEKQYARCHYVLFHHWTALFPHKEVWKCNAATCQLRALST